MYVCRCIWKDEAAGTAAFYSLAFCLSRTTSYRHQEEKHNSKSLKEKWFSFFCQRCSRLVVAHIYGRKWMEWKQKGEELCLVRMFLLFRFIYINVRTHCVCVDRYIGAIRVEPCHWGTAGHTFWRIGSIGENTKANESERDCFAAVLSLCKVRRFKKQKINASKCQ